MLLPVLVVLGGASPLRGQGSELTLRPENPAAGGTVAVVYRAAPELAGERELRLRARLREPGSRKQNAELGSREAAVLTRGRDGSFRGAFRLPEGIVFAALAVENREANRVDSRQGRFWEVLAHDSAGRPLFEALRGRFHDNLERDRLQALDAVRALTRHYPDRIDSWVAVSQVEPWALGAAGAAAAREGHLARFRATDGAYRAKEKLPEDEVSALYAYAVGLGEESAAAHWMARLRADHPGSTMAMDEHTRQLARELAQDGRAHLQRLDALWPRTGNPRARLTVAARALDAALALPDTAAAVAWGARLVEVDPSMSTSVARSLAARRATRALGIPRLREELRVAERAPDDRRSLGATRAEHRAAMQEAVAGLRADLARAVLAEGNTTEGLALMEAAAAVGWSTARYRGLGRARLAAGDSAGARSAFARAAADPALPPAAADSLRMAAGATPEAWRTAVDEGRTAMLRATLASAGRGSVPDGRLVDAAGRPTRLRELLGPGPAVVHFWSSCHVSTAMLPRVKALRERLRAAGVPVLAVTGEDREPSEAFLREAGVEVDAHYDTRGEVARALGVWVAPQFFVLDGAGRVRFAFSRVEDVERQVAALLSEAGP